MRAKPSASLVRAAPLPVPLTPLVGRDHDVQVLAQWLRDVTYRLITLTGAGGVGKTRLAIAVAASMTRHDFPDGVGFIDLTAIRQPEVVLLTIARTLRVGRDGDPLAEISDAIGTKRMLLVLDNLEQVAVAGVQLAHVLARCPRLTFLVTSRVLLNVSGERDYVVPPLPVIDPGRVDSLSELERCPAAMLFLQRARAVRGGTANRFTDDEAAAIARICQRLDGLPLAIELAAARTAVLSPAALLNRLNQRLDVLTSGPRDRPERQQTMRAAIQWSDELLLPDEQLVFHRLGLFTGGFSLEAAEMIARPLATGEADAAATEGAPDPGSQERVNSTMAALESLIAQSLVLREPNLHGETRFRLLETVRAYALERLEATEDLPALRSRHARYYARLAEAAAREFYGPRQSYWLDRMEAEHDNLRGALAWLIERGEATEAVMLSSNLWRFWEVRGYLREGRRWLERALALPGPIPPALHLVAYKNLGNLLYRLGDLYGARRHYQLCLEESDVLEYGAEEHKANALNNLGLVASALGEYELAERFFEQALALRRQIGPLWYLSLALHNAGENLVNANRPQEARPYLEEALSIRRVLDDRRGMAYVQYNLGRASMAPGDDRALQWHLDAIDGFRAADEHIGLAESLSSLALYWILAGEPRKATAPLAEALQLRRELGDRRGIAITVAVIAHHALARGDAARAARLIGALEAGNIAAMQPIPALYRQVHEDLLRNIETVLTPEHANAERAAGRVLGLNGILDEAVAEVTPTADAATVGPRPVRGGQEATLPGTKTGQGANHAAARAHPLTPREVEVLALVAAGLGDREIAGQLGIGQRTVSSHVANILSKLNVPSRAAAAAEAVRLGIA